MDYAKEFLITHKHGQEIDMLAGSFLTMNFDEPCQTACRACIPTPHLTPNGHVSVCDMSVDGNVLPELIYGEYDKPTGTITYDYSRKSLISERKADNLSECQDCPILLHCAGGCIGECLNETGVLRVGQFGDFAGYPTVSTIFEVEVTSPTLGTVNWPLDDGGSTATGYVSGVPTYSSTVMGSNIWVDLCD